MLVVRWHALPVHCGIVVVLSFDQLINRQPSSLVDAQSSLYPTSSTNLFMCL